MLYVCADVGMVYTDTYPLSSAVAVSVAPSNISFVLSLSGSSSPAGPQGSLCICLT